MNICTFLIWIPASGKSTYAKNNGKNIVSTDSIRKEINGDENIQANGGLIFNIAHKRIIKILKNNEDVIFDATNITRRDRKKTIEKIRKAVNSEIEFVGIIMLCSVEDAINNQRKRKRQVPTEIIESMYTKLQNNMPELKTKENTSGEFDKIITISPINSVYNNEPIT